MVKHVLGTGPLTWDKSERVSDRYGAVYLDKDNSLSETIGKVEFNVELAEELASRKVRGRLTALVKETRKSTHVGDLTHKIFPETPEVGEVIVLSDIGFFFVTKNYEGACAVGIIPEDGRRNFWLIVPSLYCAHEQTVTLIFEELEEASVTAALNNRKGAARVASEWWANAILNPTHDDGDKGVGGAIFMLAMGAQVKEVEPSQQEKFATCLYEKVLSRLEIAKVVHLTVDYVPEGLLAEAARESGVKGANFPSKTIMWVTDTSVSVAKGYGASSVIIHATKDYWVQQVEKLEESLEEYKIELRAFNNDPTLKEKTEYYLEKTKKELEEAKAKLTSMLEWY
jgi:hypothetical protein